MTATEQKSGGSSVLANSAVMAAGTLFSRASGFIRSALLVAALGSGLHADVFNIANTVPNMLYILLAGGVFNAVLVPQLVKAQKNDADGGAAYTDRIITLAGLFLGVVTVILVLWPATPIPCLASSHQGGLYAFPSLKQPHRQHVSPPRHSLSRQGRSPPHALSSSTLS